MLSLPKGRLAVHDSIKDNIEAIFGRDKYYESGINKIPIVGLASKGLDWTQARAKSLMFWGSGFHLVQESVHALLHLTNPFTNIPQIDLEKNERQKWAAKMGLQLKGDYNDYAKIAEGLANTKFLEKAPGIGRYFKLVGSNLFEKRIPGLKYKTFENALGRNLKNHWGYGKEVASGKMTVEQVARITANQINEAFGHQNMIDLGRSQTMQHVLRTLLVAPDFFEARHRFMANAALGAMGSKANREQFMAMAVGAMGLAVSAKASATLLQQAGVNAQWDLHNPFALIVNNREYSLRSVPEDLMRLLPLGDPGDRIRPTLNYARNRLSPIQGKLLLYMATGGHDYKGNPQSFTQFLKETSGAATPSSLRGVIPGAKNLVDLKGLEQVAVALTGVQIKRYSPEKSLFDLAKKYKESKNMEAPQAIYPVSKYKDIKDALNDGDIANAKEHWLQLLKEQAEIGDNKKNLPAMKAKLAKGFAQSMKKNIIGNAKDELSFVKSLRGNDLVNYREAMKEKREALLKFRQNVSHFGINASDLD